MTLLSTIQRAAVLAGQARPAIAAASTDTSVAQMVELARLDAEELAGRADWNALVKTWSFNTAAATAQTAGLPDDFGRMPFRGALRQSNRLWSLIGPTPNVEWERLAAYPSVGYPIRWRIYGNEMQMLPAPPADQTVTFDYVTSNLYQDKDGTPKATWDVDDDTCLLPESAIALGVIWRWRALKGLDYAEHMRTAEMEIERAMGRDGGGKPVLHQPRGGLCGPLGPVFAFPGVLGH